MFYFGGATRMKFKISGIHCDSCNILIKTTLEEMAGISKVDIAGDVADVTCDGVDAATIISAIEDMSFTAVQA